MLKIENGSVQVVGAVIEHAQPLVAACLVVQDDNDHVTIYILALVGVVLQNLFGSLQILEGLIGLLVLQVLYALVVDLV